MNSTQLKVFHAVARAGSFSGAAERLALTQPAVSDHIRKLEEAHGTRLFIRGPRGAMLTDIGRKLLAIAESHAEAEHEARELLSRAGKLEEGELRIGADAAVHVLPAIRRFRERYPGITVKLESGNSQVLLERLRSFAIDFAVVAGKPEGNDLSLRSLRKDTLVAIVGATSGFASKHKLHMAEFADIPLVLREEGSATRALVLKGFATAGIELRLALEVEGREACHEAVAQGLGVAIVSRGEVAADPRIKVLPVADIAGVMEEHLACLRNRINLRLMQSFLGCATAP